MDRKNKVILTIGISVASTALLATMVSVLFPGKAPDPKELGSRKKVTYMASKEFARLPEAEKTKYMSKMGRPRRMFANLSSVERKAVFKNTRKIMHKQMKERINKFFKMSEEEQNKILDKMIAQGEKFRKARAARRKQNNNKQNNNNQGPPRGPRGNRNAMMQGILENTSSTTRAQMMEFFRRMQARRKKTQGK